MDSVGYGTPVASLVLHVVIILALNLAPLETLVEADMLLTVPPSFPACSHVLPDAVCRVVLAGREVVRGIRVVSVAAQEVGACASVFQGSLGLVWRVAHHHSQACHYYVVVCDCGRYDVGSLLHCER
jgi:hypothetical protein